MKIITSLLFSIFMSSVLICSGQDSEVEMRSKYHYNEVYDYNNDTLVKSPFHIDSMKQRANGCLGVPYVSPGRDKSGFDCSGFTFYCFSKYDIILPYSAHEQAEIGESISLKNVEAGDLLFFMGYDMKDQKVHHVAIAVNKKGEKIKFIHATSHHGVHYDSMDNDYFKVRFIKAKRVL